MRSGEFKGCLQREFRVGQPVEQPGIEGVAAANAIHDTADLIRIVRTPF